MTERPTLSPSPGRRRAVIVRNPAARGALPSARLEEAVRAGTPPGWIVEILEPGSSAEAREMSVAAAESGASAILANGGDGTLNAVIDALAAAGAIGRVEVGVIPAGTANVWAREAGIPVEPEAALQLLEAGHRARADLGRLTIDATLQRRFLLMCSAGLDARVVRTVEREGRWKRRLGRLAFLAPAVATAATAPPVETTIEITSAGAREERRAVLYEVLAGNSRLYGGVVRPASQALMDDGSLDLLTIEGDDTPAGRLQALGRAERGLRGELEYVRGERFVLRPDGELAVQVDGDLAGVAGPGAPITLEVEPRAATLIVTRRARRLFLQW